MQVSTEVFEDLAAQVAEMGERLREVTRLHEIVLEGTDGTGAPARRVGKHAGPKRDRHLWVVRDGAR
jgi:hypothetical protein